MSWLSHLLVVFQLAAVLVVAAFLLLLGILPLFIGVPHGNGIVLHQELVRRIVETGFSLNPWIATWGGGAAVLEFRGSLGHMLAALVSRGLSQPSDAVVVAVNAFFLAALPLALWVGMRGLGLRKTACTFGAISVLFLGAKVDIPLLKGLQTSCFVWTGEGEFSRLVGIVFAFLVLGKTGPFVLSGKGSMEVASLLLALSWWAHFGVGYGLSLLLVTCTVAAWDVDAVIRWVKVHAIAFVSLW
jgi:hypothetical protein